MIGTKLTYINKASKEYLKENAAMKWSVDNFAYTSSFSVQCLEPVFLYIDFPPKPEDPREQTNCIVPNRSDNFPNLLSQAL